MGGADEKNGRQALEVLPGKREKSKTEIRDRDEITRTWAPWMKTGPG
jgi:hypothetical protein